MYGKNITGTQTTTVKPDHNHAGNEAWGNVLVHGLWVKGSGCMLDIRVTDIDAKSY